MKVLAKDYLPKIVVVTQSPAHGDFLKENLSRFYSVGIDFDITDTHGQSGLSKADVVVIDQNGRRDGNIERFLEFSKTLKATPPGLIIISGPDTNPDVDQLDIKVPSKFLKWPLTTDDLRVNIHQVIGENAELKWSELPDNIGRPLSLSVKEYQEIADAIRQGKPIDFGSAVSSCQSLIKSVGDGLHHEILSTVQGHHNYTYIHSIRVATLLTLFGHALGLSDEELTIMSTGGMLHDVGKMAVPLEILDKPAKLTEAEWPIMRDHVMQSIRILDDTSDITNGIMIIAGQHHEKIDGSGYPLGLKGGELNELARMSAIVDIFGALTDVRSYKPAFSTEKAFSILESMDREIDQHMLRFFRYIFES